MEGFFQEAPAAKEYKIMQGDLNDEGPDLKAKKQKETPVQRRITGRGNNTQVFRNKFHGATTQLSG